MRKRKILLSLVICSFVSVSFPASYAVSQDKVVVIPLNSKAQVIKKSFTLSRPPSSFVPSRPIDGTNIFFFEGDMAVLYNSTYGSMAAPVNLPEGSEIHHLECALFDNNSTNVFVSPGSSVTLWRRPITSTAEEDMASFTFSTSGVSTHIQSVGTSIIDNPIVANSQYQYGLYVEMKAFVADAKATLRVYGCQISYYLDVVAP